jgi:hypothetical protein
MAGGQLTSVIQYLRTIAAPRAAAEATDSQLVKRFTAQRDETAFAVLLQRHGPMVLGVCERVLHNAHDAEDAFQATFLVFVRRPIRLAGRSYWAIGSTAWPSVRLGCATG